MRAAFSSTPIILLSPSILSLTTQEQKAEGEEQKAEREEQKAEREEQKAEREEQKELCHWDE
jgi:hypothetical protein